MGESEYDIELEKVKKQFSDFESAINNFENKNLELLDSYLKL